ncbi:MAG: hypothetical protein PHG04_04190 [Candidatus Nanoarchaeia archaeon]|nr:hypothetical protein [Candidatus Nanoarchaeia archaeon]MDD5054546.1 hypothetical protein [Candidatus Nanoarchaeia archaeon]
MKSENECWQQNPKNFKSFEEQFVEVKKEGVPCAIEEARKWYVKNLRMLQHYVYQCCNAIMQDTGGKIPYHNISDENHDLLFNNCEFAIERLIIYKSLAILVRDLYKNKNEYNAWKLEKKATFKTLDEELIGLIKEAHNDSENSKKTGVCAQDFIDSLGKTVDTTVYFIEHKSVSIREEKSRAMYL